MLTDTEKAELVRQRDTQAAVEVLKHIGFEYLSGGVYARVYRRDADTVVKVGHSNTDGWRKYAELCQRASDSNPYFLRVFWYHPFDYGYIAEVERLEHHPSRHYSDDERPDWARTMKRYLETLFHPQAYPKPDTSCLPMPLITALEAIKDTAVTGNPLAAPDLHGGNWMMRGDQVVITDPLA